MSSNTSFPHLPKSGLQLPNIPLLTEAVAFTRQHMGEFAVNHSLRCAYFALLLAQKLPWLKSNPADMEVVLYSIIMHDLGWSTTKELLSADKRFEVDGADISREWLQKSSSADKNSWTQRRMQLVWDSIALHTIPSIFPYKEPEVKLAGMAILADFLGPNLPGAGITPDEYKEIIDVFPRIGFKEEWIKSLCCLCREKKATTFDNFVKEFGLVYGLDGKGSCKEEFAKEVQNHSILDTMLGSLDAAQAYE